MADNRKDQGGAIAPEKGGFYNPPPPDVVRNYDGMAE